MAMEGIGLSEIKAARKALDAKRARDAPDGFRLRNKMARAARRAIPEIKAARKALDAKSLSKQHQALPVHVRTRVGEAGAEAASLSEDQVRERATDMIKQCSNAHGGSFDPSQIRHKNLGLPPPDERMYSRLNKLLRPGRLREFVDGHPEFAWHQKGKRGMVVTWADAAASATSAPGSASAAKAICDGKLKDEEEQEEKEEEEEEEEIHWDDEEAPCTTSAPGFDSAAEPS